MGIDLNKQMHMMQVFFFLHNWAIKLLLWMLSLIVYLLF